MTDDAKNRVPLSSTIAMESDTTDYRFVFSSLQNTKDAVINANKDLINWTIARKRNTTTKN